MRTVLGVHGRDQDDEDLLSGESRQHEFRRSHADSAGGDGSRIGTRHRRRGFGYEMHLLVDWPRAKNHSRTKIEWPGRDG